MTTEVDVTTLEAQLFNANTGRREALEQLLDAQEDALSARVEAAKRRRECLVVVQQLEAARAEVERLAGQGLDLGRELGRAAGILDAAAVPPCPGALSVARRVELLVAGQRVTLERAQRAELACAQLVSARFIRRRPEA